MPRKIKLENKVKKQKQKQTQKQIVKQSVVVRLDGVNKKKRQYKRRKQREGSGGAGKEQYNMTAPPLLPNVIYQSTQYLPYTTENPTVKVPLKSEGLKTGTPSSMFEDVGVGREGFLHILEKPEPDYIPLIAKPAPIENLVEETGKIPNAFIPSINVKPIQDTLQPPYDIPLERTSNYQSMQNQLEPKEDIPRVSSVKLMSNEITEARKKMNTPAKPFNFADYQPVEKPFNFADLHPPFEKPSNAEVEKAKKKAIAQLEAFNKTGSFGFLPRSEYLGPIDDSIKKLEAEAQSNPVPKKKLQVPKPLTEQQKERRRQYQKAYRDKKKMSKEN
jgi:hypothetical protein